MKPLKPMFVQPVWRRRCALLVRSFWRTLSVKAKAKPLMTAVLFWMAAAMLATILLYGGTPEAETADRLPPDSAGQPVAGENPAVSGAATAEAEDPPVLVPIYRTASHKVERIPLEDYVRGVVAAEMPAEFELEALKAQALAARTYIVRKLAERDFGNVPAKEAWATDTTADQAYLDDRQLLDMWGGDTPENRKRLDKINRAVQETKGMILTFSGKPIDATYFSTSNGYTENSEDYWGNYIPYLRSVPSPWDRKLSPRYRETVRLGLEEFVRKLGVGQKVPAKSAVAGMQVLERTGGNRIKTLRIAGKTLSGRDVRERLQLNSTQFTWKIKGSTVEITTYGYGHGVGMSQWGANGMAKEGKTAEEIVKHYYTGIDIENGDGYLRVLQEKIS